MKNKKELELTNIEWECILSALRNDCFNLEKEMNTMIKEGKQDDIKYIANIKDIININNKLIKKIVEFVK